MDDAQVGPVLEAMEDILAALLRSLDGRVYVAVGRGLWDFTAKDIYDYVDSLQEGKENKVSAYALSVHLVGTKLACHQYMLRQKLLCCLDVKSCQMAANQHCNCKWAFVKLQ